MRAEGPGATRTCRHGGEEGRKKKVKCVPLFLYCPLSTILKGRVALARRTYSSTPLFRSGEVGGRGPASALSSSGRGVREALIR